MSEPFDPNIHLRPAADGLPATDGDAPAGLGSALSLTRHAFSGLEDLPVDEPDLEGMETLPTEEPSPPTTAVPLAIEPGAITESAADAAMLARVHALEAELATLRTPALPTISTTPATPAVPLTVGDDIYNRITDRFQSNFAAIQEQRAEESDADFERRRARSFAETIVAAVYEDLLPTEAVQARFQPTIERVAQNISQQTVQQSYQAQTAQQQQDTLVAQAVAQARAQGFDVHLPGTPQHLQSRDSRLFWGAATQIDPALPGDQQIRETLALMPVRTPAPSTPTPTPTRPQPMARAGTGPVAAVPGEGEYTPMTMAGMVQRVRGVQTIGGGRG